MINGLIIAEVACKKDLGVLFNIDLDYQRYNIVYLVLIDR